MYVGHWVSLKISCLILTESSHDIVESSHYILHDCSHMLTTEIELNLGAVMAPRKTDNAKSIPLMFEQNAFGRFLASVRPIIYVCGDNF